MNFLIVDDHPLIVEGYRSILQSVFPFFCFHKAHTVDQAFSLIRQNTEIDCFILDYDLPICEIYGIVNGTDLAREIRRYYPQSKIMMITAHEEILTIYHIHKKAFPDALMVKKDVTAVVLIKALEHIQNGERFYSETVKKCMAQISKKDLMWEENNIQILLFLAKGYKIKNISELMGLSGSGVQKRILLMKEAFDVVDNGGLVREAVKQGYI
ncbi:response regulator transcription factor [Flavobacterium sp. NKUCC04_CG]|uniref:response regulator transcription factor n=1 Tax=Flavobacterium sp. NKUCC04_CG TaxID=2842121 RepID=UPI001C5A67C1|nr:response regulator transcription factor [Flavobacterium sp. NKUCC04_CG]MBW3518455.1 response regulator transcription factor [Flavobacterium sp. NKUCC04_CG]